MDLLTMAGRTRELFRADIGERERELGETIRGAAFLVVGAAGSVGHAVTREIFQRDPRILHLVDLSENNLVELVRDLRGSLGYTSGEFAALPLDCGSAEFRAFLAEGPRYDYILNLSALKHVRSEKDPWSLMRMIRTNIVNAIELVELAARQQSAKYFAVSTDKACRPANMMGVTKSIMELFLLRAGATVPVSTARFANVLFSDGSLPHGFTLRFAKRQPISAPLDVRRWFITPAESGELCLMSALLGGNREIFFPKPSDELRLTTFPEIAERYLASLGYTPFRCASEQEARDRAAELIARRQWPCYYFTSDTTGEKDEEEFHAPGDDLDLERFRAIGVIRSRRTGAPEALDRFLASIRELYARGRWTREELISLCEEVEPEFRHQEAHKFLDEKM